MTDRRTKIPPYIRRGLLALIILLMGISVARLLVTMHRMDERLGILEHQIEQLMADTSRLQVAPQQPRYPHSQRDYAYSDRTPRQHRQGHKAADSQPWQEHSAADRQPQAAGAIAAQSSADTTAPATSSAPTSRTDKGYPHKFTEPHLFDLNTIDSLTLIRIPGIASRTASVILRQRQRYGGFHTPRQLAEFLTWDAAQEYLDEWINLWFTADASRLRPVMLNSATISELQRHPYISHEQAVEIAQYRRRHKRFSTAAELQQLSSFSIQQLDLLLPYLSLE